MVWGAMSSAGVAPLCFLKSKVNAALCQDVLEHFMLPAADQLYGDADFIFQQDLKAANTSAQCVALSPYSKMIAGMSPGWVS